MASALNDSGGVTKLEALTKGGFTIFAPVDDAWTDQVKTAMNDSSTASTILGGHVCVFPFVREERIDRNGISIPPILACTPASTLSQALTPS